MRLVTERGVPPEERSISLGGLTDWDAARIFLEVVRRGSFRSAAERLELSINAVRRRIDDFERQIGATLFTRDVHGTRLTDEGALVVSAVERMESYLVRPVAAPAVRSPSQRAHGARGPGLRHRSASERSGCAPPLPCRISAIVSAHHHRPALRDALRRRVAAQGGRRRDPPVAHRPALDVKVVKLGRMHLMCFASQKYIDTYGAPKTLEELIQHHRVVVQVTEQATMRDILATWCPGQPPRRPRGHEDQCQQRELLGGRQRGRYRRVPDLCDCARRENSTARRRAPSAGGYLACRITRVAAKFHRVRHMIDLARGGF